MSRRRLDEELDKLRPGGQARVVFLRSLSAMVAAGIPVDRCLGHLSRQSDDPAMGKVADYLCERVRSGHMLSSAMDRFPKVFSRLQIRLVQM